MSNRSQIISISPTPSLTYRLVSSFLVFPIFRGLFRGSTQGNANVPKQGALVVAARWFFTWLLCMPAEFAIVAKGSVCVLGGLTRKGFG